MVHASLALRLIAKAKASNDPLDEPLRAARLVVPGRQTGRPANEAVLAEINGLVHRPQSHAEALFLVWIATVNLTTDHR